MFSKESSVPLSREKLKTLRSLCSTRIRKRRGLCLVEGERAIEEAARRGYLLYLVCSLDRVNEGTFSAVTARFPGTPVYTLDSRFFSELSDIGPGPGILGVARIPHGSDLEDLRGREAPSVLVYLDGLQEPGNVGGIIRTSWALGAAGIMLSNGTADPFSARGIRASAGCVFNIPIHYGVKVCDLNGFQAKGYSIFLAEAGGLDLHETRFPSSSILVLGNEAHGFSKEIRKMGQTIGIEMVPGADSLNVVVAGSIILERMTRDSKDRFNV